MGLVKGFVFYPVVSPRLTFFKLSAQYEYYNFVYMVNLMRIVAR